jgi:hypothetical protein
MQSVVTRHLLATQVSAMSIQIIFLPKKPRVSDDRFQWKLGGKQITAEHGYFIQADYFGELYWAITGGAGNFDDENYFSFGMILPYKGDDALAGVYKLSDGLTCTHRHWISAPPGFEGMATVDADSATLNIIKYDSESDIVEGTFEAVFKSHGYRLNPKGTFTMKRLREAKSE